MTAHTSVPATPAQLKAAATLYHAYFTGLILGVSSKRGRDDAGEFMQRVFRHQHHEKFLSSFDKLGLSGLPDAVAAAAYHYLSNRIGGVSVEFMRESDRKAWVRFVPPRWIYDGTAICGVPSEVSRGILRGWYAHNGVSLNNPRLGFVCTAQTMDGQHGLAGYFLEHDRDLAPDERLQFKPGEEPPPFDEAAAPRLDTSSWTPERLAKANRNYAMEYLRTGLPRLTELFGPAEAAYLGRSAAQLIGMQYQRQLADLLAVRGDSPAAFAQFMAGMAAGQGDVLTWEPDPDSAPEGGPHDEQAVLIHQSSWRLMAGLAPLHPAVFEAWNGLWEGALMVHNRFLVLEPLARMDLGDARFTWRVRRRGVPSF